MIGSYLGVRERRERAAAAEAHAIFVVTDKQRNWLRAKHEVLVRAAWPRRFLPETAECRPPERLAMEVTQYEVLYSESSGCGAGLLRVWTCISSSSSTTEPMETAAPGQ